MIASAAVGTAAAIASATSSGDRQAVEAGIAPEDAQGLPAVDVPSGSPPESQQPPLTMPPTTLAPWITASPPALPGATNIRVNPAVEEVVLGADAAQLELAVVLGDCRSSDVDCRGSMARVVVPILVTGTPDENGDLAIQDVGSFESDELLFRSFDGTRSDFINVTVLEDMPQFPRRQGELGDGRRWSLLWLRSRGSIPPERFHLNMAPIHIDFTASGRGIDIRVPLQFEP